MGKALIIGCGGVASVAIHKCCQNSGVFEEICIASRTKSKCDALRDKLAGTTATRITTAQVDANDVDQLIALIREVQPDVVMNLALPYQDLTIMDACLACRVNIYDTANYRAGSTAHFEIQHAWAYRDRFRDAGITALLGSGFDPGVTGIFSAYALKHHFDTIEYIDILDCNAGDHGYPFATNFNRRLISAKCRQRAVTGKTAAGSKQSRWRSSVSTTSRRSANAICTCCTMRRLSLWRSTFQVSAASAFS